MAFIGTINRTPPGTTDVKYAERWADRCRQWVVQQGVAADITALTFLIGILCAGDVDFVDPDSVGTSGGVLSYGLTDGTGRRPKNGWLIVLRDGQPVLLLRISISDSPRLPLKSPISGRTAAMGHNRLATLLPICRLFPGADIRRRDHLPVFGRRASSRVSTPA
jgi:hypothetical protein